MPRLVPLPVFVLLASSLTALSPAEAAQPVSRPNILFIFSDDHCTQGIGAYGGRLAELAPTPNIDRLAKEGVRLTNCFVTNSICSPSRACVMTGQYSHVNGVRSLDEPLPPERQMLAHAMRHAGYQTAILGKWHLVVEPAAFDAYCVLPGQGSYFNPILHFNPASRSWIPRSLGTILPKGSADQPFEVIRASSYDCVHADDAITALGLAWLKSRDKSRPFFLMQHYKGPHDNFENAERYDFLYNDVTIPEPESLWRRGDHGPRGQPQHGTSVSHRNPRRNMGQHMFVDPDLPDEEYTRTAYQRYLKKYLRTVRGVDDGVGQLLDYLDKTGELDNTIVVYSADQGFMLGEHDYIDKRWMYDESMRMPFLVRYPKRIRAGTVVDDLVNNTDFAPTLLELAGVPPPGQPAGIQGRSFAPNLEGRTPADWRQATYYRYWLHMAHHDVPAHFGIRTQTHKLIFFYGLPLGVQMAQKEPTEPYWELYDLARDPKEMHNLAGDPAHTEVFAQLKQQLAELRREVGDTDAEHPEVQRLFETVKP
ncbi:MAG: sulfatase [Planctomycetota bacterium]